MVMECRVYSSHHAEALKILKRSVDLRRRHRHDRRREFND